MFKFTRKYSKGQIIIAVIIILGIITSLIQFLYNPGLWLDESYLALNIIHRTSYELLAPLDYEQVAPVLFLQIEKLFSTVWPNSEYGFRLFPLLCFWGSILFFNQIIKKQSDSIYVRAVALSFFALSYTFIYYSNEVKQYMSDVFVLLCIFYFLLKDYKKEKNKYWLLGIIGMLSIFLSNVAPILLFTCGIYLLCDNFSQLKKRIIPLFTVSAAWMIAFLSYYCFFIHNHPLQEFMVKFWSNEGAFLPSNPFTLDFYVFLKKVPGIIFSAVFTLNDSKIQTKIVVMGMILLFTAGIITLAKRKNVKILIISCIPLLLHLLLSSFQLYPFARRLFLYTLPGIILVCSFGFDYILNIMFPKPKIEKLKLYALVSFMSIICLQLFVRLPIRKEGLKECIKYVQNNANADESICYFIYDSMVCQFQYYKDIGVVNNELNVIKPSDFERYIGNNEYSQSDDLKMQLHNKVWLLMDRGNVIIHKIDSLGYNRIKEFKTKRASVYLYDFVQ